MPDTMSVRAILSAKDSGFTSTLGKAQSVVGNLAGTVKSGIGFGILAGAGQQAFSTLSSAAIGFAKSTIGAGTDFESTMSSVAAISSATGDDLAMLTEKAKEMGAKTKFSATESANAMEYMAMAGWKAEDMVSGIEGIMNLAAASGADLARTSDIVTDALTAFGQSASDSGRFADVMAAAAANANTNVDLMGETFKYVGAVAGAMGYSIEDVAVATGLMANNGVKGTQAGTALRSIITRLAKPTKESKEAMKALGLSITDSEGNMKSFGDIMSDMRKGMQDMTEDQKAAYAAMLGGQEAMSGLLAIANASEEDFNKLTDAINNCSGSAEEMAKIKLDNLKGDITILKSGLEGLGITIFSKFADPFRSATKMVTDAVSKINERLSESNGIETFLENAGKYVSVFMDTAKKVGSYLGEAVSAIRSSFAEINGEFGSTESVDNFKDAMESVANVIKKVASFATEHSDAIAKLIKWLPAIAIGIKGVKIAKAVAPGVAVFGKNIAGLATKGISGIASKLFGISGAQKAVGKSSKLSSKQMLASAKSFMMLGAGVLMVAAGFALLAYSAIQLAKAGGPAIAVMFGMVGALAALYIGMMVMMKTVTASPAKLTAMATAMLAMGAAVLIISAGFWLLSDAAIGLANAGGPAIATMFGMVGAIAALMAVAAAVAPVLSAGAVGLLAFGAAVLIAAAGMALLSFAAIQLADAGTPAVVALVALTACLAGLMVVAAAVAPLLAVGAVGFLAFGAAIALVGAGALLASIALRNITAVLPDVVEYGAQAAVSLLELGGSLLVFGAGATVAGTGALVLGTGLLLAGTGALLLGAGLMVVSAAVLLISAGFTVISAAIVTSAVGMNMMSGALSKLTAGSVKTAAQLVVLGAGLAAFGAGALAAVAGTAALALALVSVKSNMKSIAGNAKTTESSLRNMVKAVNIVSNGLNTLGNKAKNAMASLIAAFKGAETKAKSSGMQIGNGFSQGAQSGLNKAVTQAKNSTRQINQTLASEVPAAIVSGNALGNGFTQGVKRGFAVAVNTASSVESQIVSKLRSGHTGVYSAGAYIAQGFASGMRSQLNSIRSAAAQMAKAADAAIRAKAKIHSPSKVSTKDGEYWGQGWINGILGKVKESWKAASKLVSFPNVKMPNLAMGYGGELSVGYEYYNNSEYTITVPLEIDGREFARATASYTQDELDRKEKLGKYIKGYR